MILDNVVWGFVGCGSVTEKRVARPWPARRAHG